MPIEVIIIGAIILFLLTQKKVTTLPVPQAVTKVTGMEDIVAKYSAMVSSLCSLYKFSEPKLILAMIKVESNGDPYATGSSGERGLLQISQVALDDVNANFGYNFAFENLNNITTNIRVAILFLQLQYRRSVKRGGGIWEAVGSYNAGERGYWELGRGRDYVEKVKYWYSVL